MISDSSRVGVVFSSGFFGFFAHAGFLAALRQLGVKPCVYAGSSSGAIVAAMAASGVSDRTIREMLFCLRKEDFWDPDPWYYLTGQVLRLFKGYSGYLRGNGFARLLGKLPVKRIEDLKIPLAIIATNLTDKKETVFKNGDLIRAVQASGAVPMLFKPVRIDGSLYVDGGVTNKAPVKALADLVEVDKIIVHFISSGNLEEGHGFLGKRMTPWHIHHLAVNIARQEAYQRQLEIVRKRGVEIIEVKTDAEALSPNRLYKGPGAYDTANTATLNTNLFR